ncbi:MAG TPA: FtsX-like permease family protein, partial [Anaerolineales bacterium]|nr:FtsX-like permease family protein [Anaerolineales bacterium]
GVLAREGAGRLNNGAFGLLPLETAQRYFDSQGQISQIDLAVVDEYKSSQAMENIRTQLSAYLGEQFSVVYPAEQGQRMSQMLTNYQIGLNFMSAMALFVGAFLIYNAFSMTVVERTREFGMLRTVGMTRSQVTWQVLVEALVLGIFGSAAGLGLGILMARGLTRLMESLLGQEMSQVPIPIPIAVLGAVTGILVTIMAALIPAWQAGRISPLEALMVRGRSRPGWLLRYGWIPGIILLILCTFLLILNPFPNDPQFMFGSLVVFFLFTGAALVIPASTTIWEHLFGPLIRIFYGNSGRLGSSNIQRSRLRTTLTVSALMISVSMVVIVWIITGSFKGDLEVWLTSYMGGDLFVSSSLPMNSRTIRQLSTVEGVSHAAPVRYFETEWRPLNGESERISVMAIDPVSYSQVTNFQFSEPWVEPAIALGNLARGDAVFISSVLAEKFGLKPGDQIVMKTKAGQRAFLVAGVVVNYYNQGQVINIHWQDMEDYFGYRDANAVMVKVIEGVPIDQVAARIDQQYGDREQLVVESNQKILDQISLLMRQAFSMFDVLAMISIMVGFFGITNTLTMNVIERTQEIGMLRGIGMTRSQVVRMVMAEAGLMGIIGGLMGVVFGLVLSRIFLLAMTAMSGYRIDFTVPVERLLQALLIAILVSQIAAFFPALRAARVRILEAIHYE